MAKIIAHKKSKIFACDLHIISLQLKDSKRIEVLDSSLVSQKEEGGCIEGLPFVSLTFSQQMQHLTFLYAQ